MLGTGGIVIPWILIELVNNNISFAIGLAVLYVIIPVIHNILEPNIIGGQIGLHPLIMLMSMYIGTKVLGFIGLFALPIAVVAIKHAYDRGMLHTAVNRKNK